MILSGENDTKSFNNNHDAFIILKNMTLDKNNSHYCIVNQTSYKHIQDLVEANDDKELYETTLSILRRILNLLGAFNFGCVLTVYRSPALINTSNRKILSMIFVSFRLNSSPLLHQLFLNSKTKVL